MTTERGGAAIAMAGMAGMLAVLIVAVASLSALVSARAVAVTAADGAALAAAPATYPATGGESPVAAAREVALMNGAALVRCSCPTDSSLEPRVVEVAVSVVLDVPIFGPREVGATSRAEFDPRAWLGR